jgi:uncharacterized protein
MTIQDNIKQKLETLEHWFKKHEGSIVAFSGGVDSALVLFLARKFQGKDKAIGVISNSESLKKRDFDEAVNFCQKFDIKLEVIKTNELQDPRYAENPENRCFFCKEHLFHDLTAICDKYPGFSVLSGTNYDDLGDYRPGIDAARKYEVLAPMVECKVTKDELRQIARHFGLPNWDKPASPCLSSRIPYNQAVTAEKLKQIEEAETILNQYGFYEVRVRHYGKNAKVEVKADELDKLKPIENDIIQKIKAVGFENVEIDKEGLVSGKLNRAINKN